METTYLIKVEERGKIPIEQDCAQGSTKKRKAKRPKLTKERILQIVEHTQYKVST